MSTQQLDVNNCSYFYTHVHMADVFCVDQQIFLSTNLSVDKIGKRKQRIIHIQDPYRFQKSYYYYYTTTTTTTTQ